MRILDLDFYLYTHLREVEIPLKSLEIHGVSGPHSDAKPYWRVGFIQGSKLHKWFKGHRLIFAADNR
jgi:hypothetical protein